MSNNLLYKYITERQIEDLDSETDVECFKKRLINILGCPRFVKTESEKNIVRDFYFYINIFCRQQKFSNDKISTLLSISKKLIRSDFKNGLKPIKESYNLLKDLVLMHSIQRPPRSIKVFDEQDIQPTINYFIDTYYLHYKYYGYVFTPKFNMLQPQQTRPLSEGIVVVENKNNNN